MFLSKILKCSLKSLIGKKRFRNFWSKKKFQTLLINLNLKFLNYFFPHQRVQTQMTQSANNNLVGTESALEGSICVNFLFFGRFCWALILFSLLMDWAHLLRFFFGYFFGFLNWIIKFAHWLFNAAVSVDSCCYFSAKFNG